MVGIVLIPLALEAFSGNSKLEIIWELFSISILIFIFLAYIKYWISKVSIELEKGGYEHKVTIMPDFYTQPILMVFLVEDTLFITKKYLNFHNITMDKNALFILYILLNVIIACYIFSKRGNDKIKQIQFKIRISNFYLFILYILSVISVMICITNIISLSNWMLIVIGIISSIIFIIIEKIPLSNYSYSIDLIEDKATCSCKLNIDQNINVKVWNVEQKEFTLIRMGLIDRKELFLTPLKLSSIKLRAYNGEIMIPVNLARHKFKKTDSALVQKYLLFVDDTGTFFYKKLLIQDINNKNTEH